MTITARFKMWRRRADVRRSLLLIERQADAVFRAQVPVKW